MKNNTVVMACDERYFWGAFLLAASMRMNHMDEPVLIYQTGFTTLMRKMLAGLQDITIVDAPASGRNMTCRKADAMLLATTDYISWIDCDAFFVGNCSGALLTPDINSIRIRVRTVAENAAVFNASGLYAPEDFNGAIPRKVLDVWRKDVNESSVPHLKRCVSACAFSMHRSRRDFLERWREQMLRVLPRVNTGVTANERTAYYQLDESVLNSLLCFMDNSPRPADFLLDQDETQMYWHMANIPKPWQWWGKFSLVHYNQIMRIVAWAGENKLILCRLPFALNSKYQWLHRHLTFWCTFLRIKNKVKHVLVR
ncbi:MAG: hypothetical protein PHS41_02500 [Victivallaceae bacterium]|nr:hypothetical protein [Victivallaceae bacterium]